MPDQLRVAALYANGWNSQSEKDDFETRLVRGAPSNVELVLDYTNIDDLVSKVDALLSIWSDKCLEFLEIWAHGNPSSVNDLSWDGAAVWGQELKTLRWCDEASIYLAGCNTGLRLGTDFPNNMRGPIAQDLANAMAFDQGNFEVHLRVFGSNGYLSSCKALGGESTQTNYSESEIHLGWQWPPIWRTVTRWEAYEGAQAAQGNDVWLEFRNW